MVEVGETRYLMGKSECRVVRIYAEYAKIRNVAVWLRESYRSWGKEFSAGTVIVVPVRKCWRHKRDRLK